MWQAIEICLRIPGERVDIVLKAKEVHPLRCRYSIIVKGMQKCKSAYMQKGWLVYDDCPKVPDLPSILDKFLDKPPVSHVFLYSYTNKSSSIFFFF